MLDRRRFLKVAGAASVAASLPAPRPPFASATQKRFRVAVLLEPDFPAADTAPVRRDTLGAALDDLEVTYLGAGDLTALSADRFDVFLSPYGSAFPKDGWSALLAYLGAGGNWVNLGGVPSAVPVAREGGAWRSEARQTESLKRLGFTLACAVDASAVKAWRANDARQWTSALATGFGAATVWELYYRLSSVADTPYESGSAGPMEAVVEPLVFGFDAAGRVTAAPMVMVDRLAGEFAGGRWIFATTDGAVAPNASVMTPTSLIRASTLDCWAVNVMNVSSGHTSMGI